MILGFMGILGSGKTLGATIFSYYLHLKTNKKMKIFANYDLKGAEKIKISPKNLENLNNSILVLDEIHTYIDSRQWKYNKKLMDYFLQLRKYNNFLIFTTQHFKQVDIRLRNITQYLFFCERKNTGFKYTLIDTFFKTINKTYFLPLKIAEVFFNKYSTLELIKKESPLNSLREKIFL